jgi:hypothetical protein
MVWRLRRRRSGFVPKTPFGICPEPTIAAFRSIGYKRAPNRIQQLPYLYPDPGTTGSTAVERSGADLDAAARAPGNVMHDGVAVSILAIDTMTSAIYMQTELICLQNLLQKMKRSRRCSAARPF